jgi:hypothetical protein
VFFEILRCAQDDNLAFRNRNYLAGLAQGRIHAGLFAKRLVIRKRLLNAAVQILESLQQLFVTRFQLSQQLYRFGRFHGWDSFDGALCPFYECQSSGKNSSGRRERANGSRPKARFGWRPQPPHALVS